jgi:hypothetical protein
MSLEAEHEALKLLATQRCFYLFAALLLLLVAIPFGIVLQFYLAILIARLSGVYSPPQERA